MRSRIAHFKETADRAAAPSVRRRLDAANELFYVFREAMAPHVKSSTHHPVDDSELQRLLIRVYRDGGFTDSERAATIFEPSAVRARGDILHVDGDDGRLLGMVIVVPPTSPARQFAQGGECEMHLLATSPEARRSGIGQALVKAAIVKARSEGFALMRILTGPRVEFTKWTLLLAPLGMSGVGCGARSGLSELAPSLSASAGAGSLVASGGAFGSGAASGVPPRVSAVAVGSQHSCALLATGAVKCWGLNNVGQLGDGTLVSHASPVSVSGVSHAAALSLNYSISCALLDDGSVRCWGDNGSGQLGDGTFTSRRTPVAVAQLNSAESIAVGAQHACAATKEGKVYCWGFNSKGELGNGTTAMSANLVAANGITQAIAVATGGEASCALMRNGTCQCWGYNGYGEIGDGTTKNSAVPVQVAGVSSATAIVLGDSHACALVSDRRVLCWGRNDQGQLATGLSVSGLLPAYVQGVSQATSVASGFGSSGATTIGGNAFTWGMNYTFVDTSSGPSSVPVDTAPAAVADLTNAYSISVGTDHGCALLKDGNVKCWGHNEMGQLGDGTTVASLTPVMVGGL